MLHDVFISYANQDKDVADRACEAIEVAGVRCWIAPRDVCPGIAYGDSIAQGVRSARVVVLVLSAAADDSPHVLREVEAAVNARVPILPFQVGDLPPRGHLAYFLDAVQRLDARDPGPEDHLPALAGAVRALAEQQGPAAVARPVGGRPSIKFNASCSVAFALLLLAATSGLLFYSRRLEEQKNRALIAKLIEVEFRAGHAVEKRDGGGLRHVAAEIDFMREKNLRLLEEHKNATLTAKLNEVKSRVVYYVVDRGDDFRRHVAEEIAILREAIPRLEPGNAVRHTLEQRLDVCVDWSFGQAVAEFVEAARREKLRDEIGRE
jgi:hypothetical protein